MRDFYGETTCTVIWRWFPTSSTTLFTKPFLQSATKEPWKIICSIFTKSEIWLIIPHRNLRSMSIDTQFQIPELCSSDSTRYQKSGRVSQSPEDPTHRNSLMAGVISLGPSVAPLPVKSSTAHDGTLIGLVISLDGPQMQISSRRQNSCASPPLWPMWLAQTTVNVSSPYKCGATIFQAETTLGFCLVGLLPCGPLIRPQASSECYSPTLLSNMARSVSSNPSLNPISLMIRFHGLNGRRLCFCLGATPWNWYWDYVVQTMLLNLHLATFDENLEVKKPLFKSSSFLETLSLTSSSYMERTLVTSYNHWPLVIKPHMEPILLTFELLHVELLVPTRIKVLEPLSKSLCQSTVTNLSLPEVLVNVPATHHESICTKKLLSYCHQVLVEQPSFYLHYLYVASMNAFSFHLLNFGSWNPTLVLWFSFVL